MKLLTIIVTYNAMKWAERCFHSLQTSTIIPDVFIVDNGSTDGTQTFIMEQFPSFFFRQNETNLGFGKANNIGLQYALDNNYDYVYLLNQDAWVMPDTFEKLIEISIKHPEFGILSPMQMKADRNHLDDKFVTHVICNHQKVKPFIIEDLFFNREEDIYEVSFVMAAHWLITRKCIDTVGGFSPSFYHYGEDNNYIHRTNYWKLKVGIVPCAKAVHDRSNPIWDCKNEKHIRYVQTLEAVSNPLQKESLYRLFVSKVKHSIRHRDKDDFIYAYKLFQNRKSLIQNYEKSLVKKAFLA